MVHMEHFLHKQKKITTTKCNVNEEVIDKYKP
jgi:hypothetical protein